MQNEKLFNAVVGYLKIVTVFATIMCFVLMFFKSFDPVRGLEQMLVNDMYGVKEMPAEARPMFEFVFLLFSLLSVFTLVLQYMVIHYVLAKKIKWGYWSMYLIGVAWPIGASIIALHCNAPSYFVSVGMMTALFFPPLLLLKKYF
jgi:hypothetical protein